MAKKERSVRRADTSYSPVPHAEEEGGAAYELSFYPEGGENDSNERAKKTRAKKKQEGGADIAKIYFKDMGRHNLLKKSKEREIYRKIALRKAALNRVVFQVPLVQNEVFRIAREVQSEKLDIRRVIYGTRGESEDVLKKIKRNFVF